MWFIFSSTEVISGVPENKRLEASWPAGDQQLKEIKISDLDDEVSL